MINVILTYRERTIEGKIMITDHSFSGTDIMERIKVVIEVEANSWRKNWELISVSHTYIP